MPKKVAEFFRVTNQTDKPILLHSHAPTGAAPDMLLETDPAPVIVAPGATEQIGAEMFSAVQSFPFVEQLVMSGGLVFKG